MAAIFDISVPIHPEMAVWAGDPAVVVERVKSMAHGAHDNVSRIDLGVHTGTHVDAPLHFLADGIARCWAPASRSSRGPIFAGSSRATTS